MNSGWANGLRGVVAFALLMGAVRTRGQAPQRTDLAEVAKEEPKLVAIRIVKEDGQVLTDSPSGIALETGKTLQRGKIADSLRTLYRTGDYADLQAVLTPVADGLRLDFVVRENLFFNQVRIEGLAAPPSQASATAAMQLTLGQTYRRAVVDEALDRLRETLRDEGLYQAEVSAETVPHAQTHQMDMVVQVKPGRRARVGSIQLNNGTEYRDGEILSRLKWKAGSEITSGKLQRGTDRIRKYLVKKGHLSARAAVRRGTYDAATNTIPLELEVSEGPRVKVTVTGAKLSNGELKRLIPIYQEGAVDADLLEEGKRNVLERLERQGYFDAAVDYKTETHEVKSGRGAAPTTEETITYTVERGARHKLMGIEITGNKYFDSELLRSRLQIFGGAFGSAGRFSRRLVESDTQSMRSLYLANGFLDAKV
jgi:outer membrane protein insertion porin family